MPLLLLLCCWLALVPAIAQEQVDPALQRAALQQDLLPALAARSQAAQARIDAAERWFAGEGAWTEAFPDLAGAPIGDPAFSRALAWQLQERAEQRATEQAAVAPVGLEGADDALLDRWRGALADACGLEERADQLEQRFVAGLRAGLQRAPGLQQAAIEQQLASWTPLLAAAEDPDASPEELALAAAAGGAQAELERLRQLAWRAATVPGDDALGLAVAEQLAALPEQLPEDPVESLELPARVDRLERVAPLLAPDQRAAVDALVLGHEQLALGAEKQRLEAALAAEDAAAAPGEDLPVEQLEQQVLELHETLERARKELGGELHEAGQDGMHQEVAQLRVWLEEKRLAARQGALERARRLANAGLEQEQNEARLTEARREADLAQQKADEEAERASQAEAVLRQQVAQLRGEIADLVEGEATRRDAALASIDALGARLESQADALHAAMSLPPLDPQRQVRIDDAYLGLRQIVDELRDDVSARVSVLDALQAEGDRRLERLEGATPAVDVQASSGPIRELTIDAQTARGDLALALQERERNADDEIGAVLRMLRGAKVQRRVGRGEASVSARRDVSRTFLPELVAELAELPTRVGHQLRQAGPWLRSLPGKLLDLAAIWVLLAGSVELFLLGLLWVWLRRAAPGWLERLLAQAHEASQDRDARGLPRWLALQAQRWLEPGDLSRLGRPWGALVQALVDALAAWQLARFLTEAPAIVALMAWGFAAVIAWRALPTVVPAMLATPDEQRPSLRVLSPAARERVLWTGRLVVGWWLVLVLCQVAALRLLDADRVLELVNAVGTIAFWVIVVVALHRWSPALVHALGEQPDSRLVRWAGRSSSSWLLRTLQGATALGLLASQHAARLGTRLAGGGPSMSRLAALVARRQLRDTTERRGVPLEPALIERLEAMRPPLAGVEQVHGELVEAHAAWLDSRRRGLHVVTGDRGLGRSTLLRRVGQALVTEHKVLNLQVERRIDGPEQARAWLASTALGRSGGAVPSRQELIDEISLLPGPRIFLVDDMERLLLREVGGFEALRVVLQVLHATSDEHFWVCGFHGPTWSYLRGVPGVFDPAFFHQVHPLPAAGADALSQWLGTVTQQAELELSFDDLAGIGPNTLEAERLRGRARVAFWRLLADASAGNPEVARALLLGGATVDGAALRVGLFDEPVPAQLQDLSDNELFVLTAVVVHDRLAVDQLARALNLPRSGVRTACQRLVARGILASEGYEDSSEYHLELPWIPAVERHLRNKNFLAAR